MTILLMTLSFIVGAWVAWRYENILDDFIDRLMKKPEEVTV